MRRFWVAAFLIGCGDPKSTPIDAAPPIKPDAPFGPAADIVEHGGTRLHMEWWESAEGTRAFRGLYDSALNLECRFRPHPDGRTWDCLPQVMAAVGYADAECTQPVIHWPANSTPPPVAIQYSKAPTCTGFEEHIAVYAPDARVPGTKYYGPSLPNGCSELPVTEGTLLSVKPIDVVTATLKLIPSSTHLTPTYFEANDGSVLSGQFYSGEEPCSLSPTSTGFYCAPVLTAQVTDEFSDASCTSHVIRVGTSCRFPSTAVEQTSTGARYRLLGDPVGTIYTGDSCTPSPIDVPYFTIGPIYEPPRLGRRYESYKRLQPIIATTDDGLKMHLGYGYQATPKTVYDSGLGIDCAFQRTPDATMRCLPTTEVRAVYSDADCTMPALAANEDVNFGIKRDPNDLFTVIEAYGVGSPRTMYIKGTDAVCSPITAYAVVGDAVPLETFLAGTPTMD